MPLNYSKWDQLQLSDDSDIEEHPNVDKKSMIRWMQRKIHEEREERKQKIAHLNAQIACNEVILPRIQSIRSDITSGNPENKPQPYFNALMSRLTNSPSPDCPPGNDPSKPEQTYDGMVLDLLRQVSSKAREEVGSNASLTKEEKEEKMEKLLVDGVAFHVGKLKETIEEDKDKLEYELKEQKKHITSEDLHDGFSSKYVPAKETPTALPTSKPKKTIKTTTTEFETLNPTASASTSAPAPGASAQEPAAAEDDDEEPLPELTPSLEGFAKIGVGKYEESFRYIQKHRDVVVEGASDALLVAAFRAQSKSVSAEGKSKKRLAEYARQCVHQSLLLQYSEKLGKDGVGVFFKKMVGGDKRAEKVFSDDFEQTYRHLMERAKVTQEEMMAEGGREQIQLVPSGEGTTISFNVPEGPPPEHLVLEGPGTEDMDIGEVRKALQMRWDVFCGFPEDFQIALQSNSLDEVNKVLGDMDIDQAEHIVESLDMVGILRFAEGGIRDETGRRGPDDEDVD